MCPELMDSILTIVDVVCGEAIHLGERSPRAASVNLGFSFLLGRFGLPWGKDSSNIGLRAGQQTATNPFVYSRGPKNW